MSTRLGDILHRIYTGYRPLARTSESVPEGAVRAIGLRALKNTGDVDLLQLDWAQPRSAGPAVEDQIRLGDVLFAVRGSVLKSALITADFQEPIFPSANIAVLRPNRARVDPEFLWAWSQHATERLLAQFSRASTGQLLISVGDLKRMLVDLPPMEKQKAIGEVANRIRELRLRQADVASAIETVFTAFIHRSFDLKSK